MKKSRTRPAGASVTGDTQSESADRRLPGDGANENGRPSGLTPEERYRLIAEAAYRRAEQRGFTGGDPVVDWLEAEREIERRLSASAASAGSESRRSSPTAGA